MPVVNGVDALAAHITGPLLRPGEPGYAEECSGFNLSVTHTPDLVLGAACAADVVSGMRWADDEQMPVAVQATGHGANLSVDSGLLISTRRMREVTVDPVARTATVAAGATWKDVLAASAPYGLAPLNGSSTGVGVVGYTVGGGLPVLGRAFGYAADQVRSFDVVTADGTAHVVDSQHEPELCWALRGGKGNAGIVTSLVCNLIRLPRLYGGGIFYPGEHLPDVLAGYAQWVATVPDQMCSALQALRLPPFPELPEPLRGRFVAHLCVAYPGDAGEGERLVAPMRAVAPAIIDHLGDMPYTDIDQVHQDPQQPLPAHEACLLLRELPADAVAALLGQIGPGSGSPLLLAELRHMGGALARPAAVEDAISARDARFMLETVGILAGPHAAEVPAAQAAMAGAMAPWATGRTMVNLHGTPGDEADRARAWTPANYQRLRRVKAHYDPANLLRFGHAIRPAA
jgi:FAD/FMN-containing dehydrogenase